MDRLKCKIAIVTGGASGIGKAIVDSFIEEGARVIVFDIKESGVFKSYNKEKVTYIRTDISNEIEVQQAINEAYSKYGKIDILVNNAGIEGVNKPIHLVESDEWDKVFNVNVKGVFYCVKKVIPLMFNNGGGSIINIASVYATNGTVGDHSVYHAAKGAVLAMTKQDAVTYAKKGIRINAISPGAIDTKIMREYAKNIEGGFDALNKVISKRHPIGHIGDPKDIAKGAVYLASDESKFVTGINLFIDGGYTAW